MGENMPVYNKNLLDLWYENKLPLYDISSCGVESINNNYIIHDVNITTFKDYGNTQGYFPLINTLANIYDCSPDNILVTNGSTEAIYILIKLFSQKQKEIIYQRPYYNNLDYIISESGGIAKHLYLNEANRFRFDIKDMISLITDDTTTILLNFPNNPTGAVLHKNDYNDIYSIASKRNLHIIFDDVSSGLYFDNNFNYLKKSIHQRFKHFIIVNSISKSIGLPGVRIGWIVADQNIISKCKIIKEHISISTAPILQSLAQHILTNESKLVGNQMDILKVNLKELTDFVVKYSDYFLLIQPMGGACCFFRLNQEKNTLSFCEDLYNKKQVLLVPGMCFGYDNYIRIGLGSDPQIFKASIKLLEEFVQERYNRNLYKK